MTINLASPSTRRIALIAAVAIAAVAGLLALRSVSTGPQLLKATVHCDSQRFRITNNDQVTWTNVNLELNRSLLGGAGYHHRPGDVAPGHTITFLASLFTRDGNRFNVASERLGEIRITCDLPGGRKGLYTYNW